MKLAIIGSRSLDADISKWIKDLGPIDEIVSGGARGIDTCAKEYASNKGIKLVEFLPNYELFGKSAPLIRNKQIVNYADYILAFWDGKSRGTKFVIDYAEKNNKPLGVVKILK